MMEEFSGSLEEFSGLLKSEMAVVVYLSTDECQVCKVIKPKLEEMLDEKFPRIRMVYVPLGAFPEIAGQYRIFSVPAILVYFDGHEFLRKTRNISLEEFGREISRPYSLMFS